MGFSVIDGGLSNVQKETSAAKTTAERLDTDLSKPLNSLVQCIEAIPGQRIMTLLLSDGRHVVVDIDDQNHYGYDPFVKPLLLAKIGNGAGNGGHNHPSAIYALKSGNANPERAETPAHQKSLWNRIGRRAMAIDDEK